MHPTELIGQEITGVEFGDEIEEDGFVLIIQTEGANLYFEPEGCVIIKPHSETFF